MVYPSSLLVRSIRSRQTAVAFLLCIPLPMLISGGQRTYLTARGPGGRNPKAPHHAVRPETCSGRVFPRGSLPPIQRAPFFFCTADRCYHAASLFFIGFTSLSTVDDHRPRITAIIIPYKHHTDMEPLNILRCCLTGKGFHAFKTFPAGSDNGSLPIESSGIVKISDSNRP
jgi:hypothetical protein